MAQIAVVRASRVAAREGENVMAIFGKHRTPADPPSDATPVLTRPAPAQPGVFQEAKIVGDYAVLRWDTGHGPVGLGYSLIDSNGNARYLIDALWGRYGEYLPRYYAAVAVGKLRWGLDDAPELEAIDIHEGGRLSERYQPRWQQLATVLGTKAPWWHSALRDRDAILEWKPGAPPAVVPACHVEMPIEALIILAAGEPDGSPAAAVCLWLARHLRHQDTVGAFDYVADPTENVKGDGCWLTLGAVPAELYRPDPEPLPDVVRRAGWLQILERRDTLAARVAKIARMWDSGSDWPASSVAEVVPGECQPAVEWAVRLVAAPTDQSPTVLERELLEHVSEVDIGTLLHDPATGLPAVHRVDHMGEERIFAAVPQRLPTTALLHSVTLCGSTVWIRTANGGLFIAPEHPSFGVSWGYTGSGPISLAILLDRLLDDITAKPVERVESEPPAGLRKLIETTSREGSTTYSREQLDAARLG